MHIKRPTREGKGGIQDGILLEKKRILQKPDLLRGKGACGKVTRRHFQAQHAPAVGRKRPGGEFGSLWAPFWLPLAHFWLPLAHFWLPLAPFGSLLAHFWCPLAHFWCPFLHFCSPRARFSHFCCILSSFFVSF